MDLRAMIQRSLRHQAQLAELKTDQEKTPGILPQKVEFGEKKTIRIPGIREKLNAAKRRNVAKITMRSVIATALQNMANKQTTILLTEQPDEAVQEKVIAAPKVVTKEPEKPKFTKKEYALYENQQYKAKFATPDLEFEWAKNQYKKCSKCGETKCLTEYRGNTSGQDGFDKSGIRLRRPECKACTLEGSRGKDIAKKFAKENGIPYKAPEGTVCAICGQLPTKNNGLVFDHCHKTNTFRGYCCNSCNRSVGVLGDDVPSLLRAINYLNQKEKLRFIQNEDGTLSIA